jgi:hypothetical protein
MYIYVPFNLLFDVFDALSNRNPCISSVVSEARHWDVKVELKFLSQRL